MPDLDLRHVQTADDRPGVSGQGIAPLLPMFGIAPRLIVRVEIGVNALVECHRLDERRP